LKLLQLLQVANFHIQPCSLLPAPYNVCFNTGSSIPCTDVNQNIQLAITSITSITTAKRKNKGDLSATPV
jgi:hypothetical protein